MKRTISLLSIIILLLVFNDILLAQDAQVQASANVVQVVNVENTQPLNFGDVSADLDPTPTLTPESNSSSGVTGSSQFGYVEFNGQSGKTVKVDYSGVNSSSVGSETLTNSNTTDTITLTIETSETPGNPGTPGGTDFSSGGTFTLSDSNGDHVIYVGGSLSSTNTPLYNGNFTGKIDFTIDYTVSS